MRTVDEVTTVRLNFSYEFEIFRENKNSENSQYLQKLPKSCKYSDLSRVVQICRIAIHTIGALKERHYSL